MPKADGRTERARANRAKLVAAARELVARGGFHEFRLEDVARAAGVTRPTVYNQFGSREGLIEAVLEDIGDRAVFERLADCLDLPEPAAAVRELVHGFCRAWSSDELMFRRMIGLAQVDPELGRMIAERQAMLRSLTDAMISRLAAAGLLKAEGSPERSGATLSMLCSFEVWDRLGSDRVERSEIPAVLLALVGAVVELDRANRAEHRPIRVAAARPCIYTQCK